MVDEKLRPDVARTEHGQMMAAVQLVRDLMGGTAAMQTAGERWLPKWPKESSDRYQIRLEASTLYEGLRRTVDVLAGKVFSKPVTVSDDVNPEVAEVLANVDLDGSSLATFLKAWFRDGLQAGISHVLIDAPATGYGVTVADAKRAGVRPYWVRIPADDLFYWRAENIGGRRVLDEVRFYRTVDVPTADGWGVEPVQEIRQIVRGTYSEDGGWTASGITYRTFRKDEHGDWQAIEETTGGLDEIPLATFYARKTGYLTGEPPLMGLAWTNLTHWRSSSEQRHCLSIGRRPFPAFLGFNREDLAAVEIGPHSGIVSTDPAAKVEIIEPTGAAIASGRQDLQDLKEEMAALGLELLVRKPVEKTATESRAEKEQTESDLSGMVRELEAAANQALGFTADWLGVESSGRIGLASDVGTITLNAAELSTLLTARQTREISWVTFANALKARGVLPEDLDLEAERAAIAEEAML